MSAYLNTREDGARTASLLQVNGPIPCKYSGLPAPDVIAELRGVQGNVLQPHKRRFALHVLLRFSSATPARAWLSDLAGTLTTAADELIARSDDGAEGARPQRGSRPPFLSLALSGRGVSAAGYAASPDSRNEAEQIFRQGMEARRTVLSDPPLRDWEQVYRDGCDAMLIIADNDHEGVRAKLRELFGNAPIDGVDVIGVEAGQRLTNDFGQDVEHFGYVDGTSQPLFLESDVDRDAPRHRSRGWSPAFAPRQVLVRCPGGGYGSYLVFRKLEQNLAAFAMAKERLAAQLGMVGDLALAGARIVGRYEDGQPAGLRHPAASILPVENGFVYNSDPPACPIGSHVRIVNPRTARSRATAIARRGIPYGGPVDTVAWAQPERLPSEGVGLLFMAYMADIGAQYEAIQVAANGSGERDRDPLIGQRSTAAASYAAASPGSAPLVRLRGGGYFFVPSPAFLRQTDAGGPSGSAARRPATTQAGTGYDGPRRQDAPAANGRPW